MGNSASMDESEVERKLGTKGGYNENETNDGSASVATGTTHHTHPVVEILSSAGKTISAASGLMCGSIDDTMETDVNVQNKNAKVKNKAGTHGNSNAHAPNNHDDDDDNDNPSNNDNNNPMSALFARALVNEVNNNPNAMTPQQMAQREKKLIKAQESARKAAREGNKDISNRAVGSAGSVEDAVYSKTSRILPPNLLSENRAQVRGMNGGLSANEESSMAPPGKHRITIGLCLSRRHSTLGHPDTVTRQMAFDFNELQDRDYKYVSSTDASGWRAGGGERGSSHSNSFTDFQPTTITYSGSDEFDFDNTASSGTGIGTGNNHKNNTPNKQQPAQVQHKVAAPDTVHIPIIHIDCDSTSVIDSVIAALARGEVFIPHMSILPEALGVNGISPPDLVVRFGCERNDDIPPEEWPNWCLEFMHNQLYDYFATYGAKWMKRPFQITLAKKVRWKTVKHMNKFFADSERVINAWRENGPQYLDPELTHIEGGASSQEVKRPHGVYLLRNGKPSNYFPPNFDPPYTTKMTRSLLLNVLGKSWDRKRRDWTSEPVPRSLTPSLIFSSMCGCADVTAAGYLAAEATSPFSHSTDQFFAPASPATEFTKALGPKAANQHQQIMKIDSMNVNQPTPNIAPVVTASAANTPSKSPQPPMNQNPIPRARTSSTDNNHAVESQSQNANDGRRRRSNSQSQNPNPNSTPMRSRSPMRHSGIHDDSIEHGYSKVQEERQRNHLLQKDNSPSFRGVGGAMDYTNDEDANAWDVNRSNLFSNNQNNIPSKYPDNTHGKHSLSSSDINSQQHTPLNHGMGASTTGESQTTVPIKNGAQFIEEERERRKLREMEREKERQKIDQLEMALQEKMKMNKTHMSSSPASSPSREDSGDERQKKSKKEKKDKKERKKKEKKNRKDKKTPSHSPVSRGTHDDEQNSQHRANSESPSRDYYSHQKEDKRSAFSDNGNRLHLRLDDNSLSMSQSPPHNDKPSSKSPSNKPDLLLNEITTQVSLDYSLDTASMLGDGSLIGGQFAGDGSVITIGTSASENKSLLSCVTRSTIHDMSGKHFRNSPHAGAIGSNQTLQKVDDDDISLSLLESTSNEQQIPSDDDLYAIGWAKALDPSSGSYYYFTLDRSKIVWENPLSP